MRWGHSPLTATRPQPTTTSGTSSSLLGFRKRPKGPQIGVQGLPCRGLLCPILSPPSWCGPLGLPLASTSTSTPGISALGEWEAPGNPGTGHGQWKPLLPFQPLPRALSMDLLPCPPSNSDAGKSWPAGTPTWGSRNSYLAVQVDIDQSDVAIEIDVLCDGSIVRGRDQESLWGQEWARACHPLAGAHGPPVHSPQPL